MAQTFLKLDTGVTGTLPNANFSGGKILQVLNFENNTTTQTTNSSLQDTALTLNITPSSTSSKIFIQIQPQLLASSTSSDEAGLGFGITREIDGANIATIFETKYNYDGLFTQSGESADVIRAYPYVADLDEPNTTGVCSYKFKIKAYSSTAVLNEGNGKSRMYLFEVGA